MSNFNMFAKNNSSISSSERTSNIKNTLLFNNHSSNNNSSFKNHKTYNNLKKGFTLCKTKNGKIIDNSNCFNTWINTSSNFVIKNVDDWKISKINYSSVDLTDNSVKDTSLSFWPYKNTHCNEKTLFYKDYSLLDTDNTDVYFKNFKHNISRKNINL